MTEAVGVTVIVPHYESVDTLARAIESVLKQTVAPAEIIVVDDASAPKTQDAARRLLDSVSTVTCRFESLPSNRGPGAARNLAWDLATQPLLAFLDADEEWLPSKIERQSQLLLEDARLDASAHRSVRAGTTSALTEDRYSAFARIDQLRPSQWLWRNRFATSTVMLRRELPFRFEGNGRHAEDFDLWLRMAFAGCRMAVLESPLGTHHKARFGASGLSADLWPMERGDLCAFGSLRRSGQIGAATYTAATAFSLSKYALRAAKVVARRLRQP